MMRDLQNEPLQKIEGLEYSLDLTWNQAIFWQYNQDILDKKQEVIEMFGRRRQKLR